MYLDRMTSAQFAALVQEKVNEAVINALTNHKELLNKAFEQPKNKYSTVKEVCEHFRISKMTLYNWEKKGAVKKHKFGGRTTYSIPEIETALRTNAYAFGKHKDFNSNESLWTQEQRDRKRYLEINNKPKSEISASDIEFYTLYCDNTKQINRLQ